MPDSVPLTQPGEPTATAASVVSRLGEIRQRADGEQVSASDALNLALQDVLGADLDVLNEDYGYGDLAVDVMAAMRKHGLDVGSLLDVLDVALADRDRARDLAAALEAENALLRRSNPITATNLPRDVRPQFEDDNDPVVSVGGYPTTEATT